MRITVALVAGVILVIAFLTTAVAADHRKTARKSSDQLDKWQLQKTIQEQPKSLSTLSNINRGVSRSAYCRRSAACNLGTRAQAFARQSAGCHSAALPCALSPSAFAAASAPTSLPSPPAVRPPYPLSPSLK
jgi:hypothetical protein